MKRYFPNRTERSMLVVGILIGTLLTLQFNIWAIIVVLAPFFIIAELVVYIFKKNDQDFKQKLADAKDVNKLVNKTTK